MKNKIILILILVIFIATACSNKVSLNNQMEKFISDNKITSLETTSIDQNFSVIAYETNFELGYYMLWLDDNDKINNKKVVSLKSDTSKVYVTGSATTDPFVVIIINDTSLLNNVYSAKVIFENGTEINKLFDNKKGIVIPYGSKVKENLSYKSIVISDKESKVLYSWNYDNNKVD
jgi:hypothetical protein